MDTSDQQQEALGDGGSCGDQQLLEFQITEAQAQDFIDTMREAYKEAFLFPSDCCAARAHIMCDTLKAAPLSADCEKIWCFPLNPDEPLIPTSERIVENVLWSDRDCWSLHVAVTVMVGDTTDDAREMVIDPAVADHPVDKQRWLELIGGVGKDVRKSPTEVFVLDPKNPAKSRVDTDRTVAKGRIEKHTAEVAKLRKAFGDVLDSNLRMIRS